MLDSGHRGLRRAMTRVPATCAARAPWIHDGWPGEAGLGT
ncbi:hypothetical protein RR42_s2189 [Cupriavidus basilensis]|uniref:Uncharacterized protein n=1 Tax=Cupriavidus basilensis TaxID=68895 RepID=A0A0C4YSY5_9BURK|nr:hypothetical protein RR42_s2189 [Cupriavidus basilensis]